MPWRPPRGPWSGDAGRTERRRAVVDQLKSKIRDIQDFPKKGILFKDLTPMLSDPDSFRRSVDLLAERYDGQNIDLVVGVEARGFIIGAALAYRLGAGVILIRKPGKLPYKTHHTIYELEYGTDQLEIHQDAIQPGQKVVIADDLLATGGTMKAAVDLVGKFQGEIVECAFLVELTFLKGREKLNHPIFSLMSF
jgi:adenine phosphoribosyltransferase